MSNIIRFPRGGKGAQWVLDELAGCMEKGDMILGFAFPSIGEPTSAILPDELKLSQLLMARAILDNVIARMMALNETI